MKTITGTIAALSDKGNKYGVKIGEDWFNGFGSPEIKKGQLVTISYEEKDAGDDRVFRNIKRIGRAKEEENPPQEPAESEEGKKVDPGDEDEISPTNRVMGYVSSTMGLCHAEAERILGRKPQTDGEMAMATSMFIEMNKKLNGLAIKKVAGKL